MVMADGDPKASEWTRLGESMRLWAEPDGHQTVTRVLPHFPSEMPITTTADNDDRDERPGLSRL
jgi:hypothetical protein